jgi:hypothetical protein
MQGWEYRLFTNMDVPAEGLFRAAGRAALEQALNELGREGWEVVAADFNDEAINSFFFAAVLKRPLQS